MIEIWEQRIFSEICFHIEEETKIENYAIGQQLYAQMMGWA